MLTKIIESYNKSDEFCSLMKQFKTENTLYAQALEIESFKNHEDWTQKAQKEFNKSLITGAIAYFIIHPKTMISAQKYYNSDFGKPCALPEHK